MIGARARAVVGVASLLVMAWTRPAQADEVLLDHLLADLDGFAGRHVEVAGHVENLRTGSSRRGQPHSLMHDIRSGNILTQPVAQHETDVRL